ncbi:hypothetical protein PG997_006444 [Apiospora hydei]|uniref:BTB domain-containing protein n=1 Tax=Apiospora hydei TaxID=1337664 RepID=A0ABR1WRX0_9PEZI
MPMNKLSTPEPVIALNVKEAEIEHTFFVHADLLTTSTYFKDMFIANPGLTEHTLPPGPDVKTVGNYVSILYTHTHTHVRPLGLSASDGRTTLSQIISLARVYRLTSKLCLDHSWVMNSAYNAAKDLLQNVELAWGPGEAGQTISQLQSAFVEWSGDYGRWTTSRNIVRMIVETFASTCPEIVFEMHTELLDRKLLDAIALRLMRLTRKLETEIIHKISTTPGAAVHKGAPEPSIATAAAGPSTLQPTTNTNVFPPIAASPELPARQRRRHARSVSASCAGDENRHNRYDPAPFR